jgi:uncharacterized protein
MVEIAESLVFNLVRTELFATKSTVVASGRTGSRGRFSYFTWWFYMTKEDAVEMFVGGLVLDPNTQAPVVVLKDENGDVCLPIWIGVAEATSIASAIKQVEMARPLTHDLMYNVLQGLEVSIQRIIITDLKDSTYYAELIVSYGDKVFIFDARPSDAIGLAIRSAAPIFVSQKVLNEAKITFTMNDEDEGEEVEEDAESADPTRERRDLSALERDQWSDILDDLDPDDFKYKM